MQLHKCASLSDLNYNCFPHFQKYGSLATWQTGSTWVWMRSSRQTKAPGAGEKEAEGLPGAEAGEQQGEGESLRFKLEQHWTYCLSGQVRGRSASRARSQENGARARSRSRGPSQVGHDYTCVFSCIWWHYFSPSQTFHLNLQLCICLLGGPAEPIPISRTCSSRPRSRKRWRGNAQQKQVERDFLSTWFWGNFVGDYWPFVYEVYEVGGLPLLWLPASTYDLPVTNVCQTDCFCTWLTWLVLRSVGRNMNTQWQHDRFQGQPAVRQGRWAGLFEDRKPN